MSPTRLHDARSSGWRNLPIGEVAPSAQAEFPEAGQMVWNLSLEDIEPSTGRVLAKQFARVSDLRSSKCSFDTRHVLYSKLRPYLNKVVVPDDKGVGTSELIPLLPNPEFLDRDYLAYYLRSPMFLDFSKRLMQGANLPRVPMSDFWRHEIRFPKLPEQRRIVAWIKGCMDRLDEVQYLRSESDKDVPLLASSCMEAIEDAGKYPAAVVADVISGSQNGRSIRPDNLNGNGFILSIRAVHGVSLDVSARKPAFVPDATAANCKIYKDDVFVSRANTMQLVGLTSVASQDVDERVIYPDLLIRLLVKREICLPRYLAYALRIPASRRQIQERAVGSSQSMVKISAKRLREISIPLPSVTEQKQLVEKFDEIQLIAAQIRENMCDTNTQLIREAVLRKAMAGQL